MRSDQTGKLAIAITCAACGLEEVIANKPIGDTAPLSQFARNRGWEVLKSGKHTCPACLEKKHMTDTAPREMETKERRQIFREIDESYDEANSRYCDGITDNTIALKLNVPRKWVTDIREENFGPDGGNVEMEQVQTLLGRVDGELRTAIDDCLAAASNAEKLQREVRDAQRMLGQIKKAVGPHRVA